MNLIDIRILLFITALFFSAFFSGSETALISISRLKLEVWTRRGIKGADKIRGFLSEPENFLTTILVGNNICLVIASSIMAVYLEQVFNGFIITAFSSFFLLIFGEALPKSFARDKAGLYIRSAVSPLRIFYIVFYPINIIIMNISKLLLKMIKSEDWAVKRFFTRKDLDMLIRESKQSDFIDEEDIGLISRFILRGNKSVGDIMIPRTEILAVATDDPIDSISEIFQKKGFSRLPLMDKDIDHIIGNINAKDILLEKPDNLRNILRSVFFVPESKPIGDLLKEMQRKRIWMAIVVGEYGGTAGLVTIEDILEEFFGEIEDEFDVIPKDIKRVNQTTFLVKASMKIEELNKTIGIELPLGDYNTLGGFIIDKLRYIPKKGEKIDLKNCTLQIRTAFRKKIGWVKIVMKEV
ncbi:MAG: hemolysin family protein [bacterium]